MYNIVVRGIRQKDFIETYQLLDLTKNIYPIDEDMI